MMEKLIEEKKSDIEIYDYTGNDFRTAMQFEGWRVAYLNHAPRFAEENFEKLERHNESDEVFVLLAGNATLLIGKERNRIDMEPHKIYNIPRGVWHHIFTTEGTSVLIVENADTSRVNSEYLFLNY